MIEAVFSIVYMLAIIVFMLAILYFTLWLFIMLPAGMATDRGRSAFGWVLLSLMLSPILACLLLWLLGDNPNSQE
ncbi:hypothetical protein [Rhodobacter ferrooxidans]|uniref:Uncharacterized protein n=1 Tax=Rhodobacter ferrooxidans TaxID=371731 RepID=C8S4P6_9RHOB|nr:hypothetical protein [Rhodobacter sp. SW2]EEW24045.1 hypothetical protein Rsw2DRAFT_3024 [Rhodobacter sp. SW2]